ncbi:MAG TPA: N-acetylmuramoyl-L-alanine amidase [Candidatus Angelobacter sp.]|jgi:N-acetylmuramoyl-L-alanine amidase
MRWNKLALGLAVIVAFVCALAVSSAPREAQLTVYTAQASYSLPVIDREGRSYIPIADLLTPLGATSPRLKGKEWRVMMHKTELKLTQSNQKAVIGGHPLDLGGRVLVEDGRVLVPLDAALPLLSQLLNTTVDFHRSSRRIFVGNTFTRYVAQLNDGDRPALVLSFSQPVKPDINREENDGLLIHSDKTTLSFHKEPVVSDLTTQQFGDGAIQSLVFSEENGTASLTVTGNKSLEIIRSDDGKTITLQPVAPVASATPQTEPQAAPSADEGPRRTPEFFVMIDPSHGGNDKGASLGGKLMEKDITLRLARELRKELEERGIAARLLRDSDIDVGVERRAEITNEQHAGIYIAIHAGPPGKGVRVYAPLLVDSQQPLAGRFLPWESAQSRALNQSQTIAQAITTELRKKGLTAVSLRMAVCPLNNIIAPAIAVELTPEDEAAPLPESQKQQNTVAAAVAQGIAQVRSQMAGQP